MSSYRCLGCREYQRRPEYRRLGLGSVCSPACLASARPGLRPKGGTKLDDVPHNVRLVVVERDRHRCRFCGARVGLHVHHITYRSERHDHTPGNLILLCREHHQLVHSNKRRWQPVCQIYVNEVSGGRQRYLVDIDRELSAASARSAEYPDRTSGP